MTTKVYIQDWLDLRTGEIKPRTKDQYQDLLNRYISPSFGETEIQQLTENDIRHLLATVCSAGHTRTAELLYVMLHAALRDLDTLSWKKIKRPKHIQKTPEAWTDAEIALYMQALETHPHGLALSLGLVLGLRRGEICGLRWGDIDFDAEEVHITNQRVKLANGQTVDCPPKSITSIRTIPIPPELMAALRKARGLPSAYLCTLSPSGLDGAHRRLVQSLSVPYIPLHGLRHSFATACLRHDGKMRSLQAIMGHSSYTTTANRYTHPDREMLRKAIDAIRISCYTV